MQWCTFLNDFIRIFNFCFPLKLVNTNQKYKIKHKNPRISECKNRLDLLLSLSRVNNDFKESYNKTKKEYDQILKAVRSEEYEHKLRLSDNKNKCMWRICREITGQNNNFPETAIKGDPEDIPNEYNNYLLSIVPDILKQLNTIPFNCSIRENDQSMFLRKMSTQELCELSAKIKNKHSSGIDDLPTSIIKPAIPVVKDVLCHIINNSFKHGIFPEQLKIALIKPLFKKGNADLMENYRPISLLPAFSKIFELCMCKRLIDFFKHCNLLSLNQHGYVPGRSTQTAIFNFTKRILESMEKGNLAIGIFLDLSRAYDCVDPDMLLRKLKAYGVRGQTLHLFSSYLTNRQQKVKILKNGQNYFSSLKENKIGIAQGSILGPILFIVFLNDLSNILLSENEHVTCYADDTNLLTGGRNVESLALSGENLFCRAQDWFKSNRLLLNNNKTKVLLFRTKQFKIEKPGTLTFGQSNTELVEHTKFLGIHLDEFLNWSNHILELNKKLSSVCYGIRVTAKYMNERTLKILYYANFESVLKYGIIFWGSNSLMEKIFVLQKRALRIVKKMGYRESCRGVFKANGILTVWGLYIYECIVFFFKNKSMFDLEVHHSYNTRSVNVNYPIHRLTITEKNPYYACLKLFNTLQNDLKLERNEKLFKRKVKQMLINLEPYCIRDYVRDY